VQFFSSEKFFLIKNFVHEAKLENFYLTCDKDCDKPVFFVGFIYGALPCASNTRLLSATSLAHDLLKTTAAIIFDPTALLQANFTPSPMSTPNQ